VAGQRQQPLADKSVELAGIAPQRFAEGRFGLSIEGRVGRLAHRLQQRQSESGIGVGAGGVGLHGGAHLGHDFGVGERHGGAGGVFGGHDGRARLDQPPGQRRRQDES